MTDLHAEPCGRSSPMLSQQMAQISREICDLLRQSSHCCLPASKFIPSYHHHFGRQCRVADYGYTKLAELFESLPHVLQVGDSSMVFTSWRCYRVFFSFCLRMEISTFLTLKQLTIMAVVYILVICCLGEV